ncbi:MAG: hypothetical protein RBR24_09330 [Candidatus Carbobacillus sp.]|nr:hypothetical protein [Candidatus Carbobacillus sp.]
MTIKVKQGQSVFDIALISTGIALNAFEIAFKNNISVTADAEGIELVIPNELGRNDEIVSVLNRNFQPATLPTDE